MKIVTKNATDTCQVIFVLNIKYIAPKTIAIIENSPIIPLFIKIKDANPDIFSLEIFKISELVHAVELGARTAGKNVNTNNFPKITGLKIFLSIPLYITFPNSVAIPPANAAT